MKTKKNNRYELIYHRHTFKNNENISKQQKLCMDVYYSGAFGLWLHLCKAVVRESWKDRPGYPIKKKYYDKGRLSCTFPEKELVKTTGLNIKRIKRYIKLLKDVGWIRINRSTTLFGQNVYTLGVWENVEDEDGKTVRKETLFEYLIKEELLTSPCLLKETTGVKDLTELPRIEFDREMKKTHHPTHENMYPKM